ncbi:hypothetical protein IEQ34_026690 [Dendrobium chrysotoxum]|uniref:Uncharacterized protein n=1 Tax=Dendrobium chrysotoxum TaxID=161865 RepID=A0AAV7FLG2_DENCH|nr:hypothetical protein IEQ34_026690 [Dendrobium chrysotoxum]
MPCILVKKLTCFSSSFYSINRFSVNLLCLMVLMSAKNAVQKIVKLKDYGFLHSFIPCTSKLDQSKTILASINFFLLMASFSIKFNIINCAEDIEVNFYD